MKLLAIPALLLAALVSTPAEAKLKVFACEPEWAALTRELGGQFRCFLIQYVVVELIISSHMWHLSCERWSVAASLSVAA